MFTIFFLTFLLFLLVPWGTIPREHVNHSQLQGVDVFVRFATPDGKPRGGAHW